jgi:hypothetical protein
MRYSNLDGFQPNREIKNGVRATSFKTPRQGTSTFPSERDLFCESIRLGLRNRSTNFELSICSSHKRLYNFFTPASEEIFDEPTRADLCRCYSCRCR